jgi:hypothetical protein
VHGNQLVIVGAFDFAGGVEATNIAAWDGVSWSPLGSGSDPYGYMGLRQAALSVVSYKGLLYVGADFSEAVGGDAAALAVWDGVRWEPVDHGVQGGGWPFGPSVLDLEIAGAGVTAALLMAGTFEEANGAETDMVARYTRCDPSTSVAVGEAPRRPLELQLSPNPAGANLEYAIRLEGRSRVQVTLFDVAGRRITSLLNRPLAAGNHWFQLDLDQVGVRSGGVYFLRVEAEGSATTQKLTLMR